MSCCAARAAPQAHPDLATIVRACGARYRKTHRLSRTQERALRDIAQCRTAALGGEKRQCDRCGAVRLVYHSCRNRHCPQCQSLARERWLRARQAELLPIGYFHLVFTLPHELNGWALAHPRVIYERLFQSVSSTLAAFAARHLGGELGTTAVLHTWGRNLSLHIHLHCIVTGGALSWDRRSWSSASTRFLFPVRALSRVFRARYLEGLQEDLHAGRLPRVAADHTAPVLAALRRRDWVVYCQPPVAGAQAVLAYLSRYTHRVALSNDRILGFDAERVSFRWKDWRDQGRNKVLVLPAAEFLRRFLQHVLPMRFMRIRHFGLLANRTRDAKLARCRALLGVAAPAPTPASESPQEAMQRLTGEDIERCPVCRRGRLWVIEILPPVASPIHAPIWDSS